MDDQSLSHRETFSEIEHGHDSYTDEELLEQSQFNAQALLMASVAALGGDDAVERWTRGVAQVFARGWDTDRDWEPAEVLDALLTNYRSFGANVIEADLRTTPSVAVIADLPDLELSETLGVEDRHADALFRIGEHLVASLGRSLSWVRDPETGDVRLEVS